MSALRYAIGTLSEQEFSAAKQHFLKSHVRISDQNATIAHAFLVKGKLQVALAVEYGVSRQLVHKQCRRLFEAHRAANNAQEQLGAGHITGIR